MAAKNINYRIQLPATRVETYDDGTVISRKGNPQNQQKKVLKATYVNNKAQRPMSPYALESETWVWSPGVVQGRHGSSTPRYNVVEQGCSLDFYPDWPVVSWPSQGKALNQALAQFKSGGANLPLFLAEAKELLGMMKLRLDTIHNFALWAKHGPLGKPLAQIKTMRPKQLRRYLSNKRGFITQKTENQVQSLWLELQWGWLPAMQDLKGFMSALCGNVAWSEVRAIGLSKDERDFSFTKNPFYFQGTNYYGSSGHGGVSFSGRTKKQYKYTLVGVLDSQVAATAAALGFTNPLSVAWELVPFSCVFDYLIPVGEFLDALDATTGYRFKAGCLSTSNVQEFDCNFDLFTGTIGKYTDYQWKTGGHQYRYFKFNRTVLTGFPSSVLRIKWPLTTRHCANSLALLMQVFRSR